MPEHGKAPTEDGRGVTSHLQESRAPSRSCMKLSGEPLTYSSQEVMARESRHS